LIARRRSVRDAEREEALMKSKRQTTRAKLERERLVRERRTSKQERKQAAAAARDEAPAQPVEDTTSVGLRVDPPVGAG
jgi:hypothetical protein